MKPLRQRELRLACLFLAPLALAACKGEKPAETGTAQGEVLPASVSDAMLPLDTVRSQPPLAPQTEATAGKPRPGYGSRKRGGNDWRWRTERRRRRRAGCRGICFARYEPVGPRQSGFL